MKRQNIIGLHILRESFATDLDERQPNSNSIVITFALSINIRDKNKEHRKSTPHIFHLYSIHILDTI